MEEILNIYKPIGITPFQLIQKLRNFDSRYKDIKIGYAGRLDPLAHGVLLLTVGEGNKKRDKYLGLNKTYEFSVLFGVSTDTYDYLGILNSLNILPTPIDLEVKIKDFIKRNIGKFNQKYPPFSSKPVNGIPLYKLAKKWKIDEDFLPQKDIEIYKFKLKSVEEISSKKIQENIFKNLRKIKGFFRQTKITKVWQKLFKDYPNYTFTVAHFSIDCSSGTYIRALANKMGEEFNCGAIAYEIYRTKMGDFEIKDALVLDK